MPAAKEMERLQNNTQKQMKAIQRLNREIAEIDKKLFKATRAQEVTNAEIAVEEHYLRIHKELPSKYLATNEDIVYLKNRISDLNYKLVVGVFNDKRETYKQLRDTNT